MILWFGLCWSVSSRSLLSLPCLLSVMVVVSTVSYKFNIGGMHTKIMKAKRGLRKGDLIAPLLFFLVMEYFHRSVQRLKEISDFNFHAKCEQLQVINISFAGDFLLFSRGDIRSIELLMENVVAFSRATGLCVNPSKCKVFLWWNGYYFQDRYLWHYLIS